MGSKMYEDVRPPCAQCLMLMVPSAIWVKVPIPERREMRMDGYVCMGSRGLCNGCYQREAKAIQRKAKAIAKGPLTKAFV